MRVGRNRPARTRRFRPCIDYLADRVDSGRRPGDSRQPLSNRRRSPGRACTMRKSACMPTRVRQGQREHRQHPGHPGSPPRRIAAEHRSAVRP
ncbi:hypothetical protein C3743_23215 [Burkholderia contaminans]|uniref:Uncharacterized protein n=1 Tax=Burkholderia contaminans TaxID=488447 RepID=A0A2S5DVD8_9BURK|nr:hypothetical protein C3743_23215 [Burkholderia contaminans]